jgi:hypothetical protein
VIRLIVSVPVDTVKAIDKLLHPCLLRSAKMCRSEFVRQAIAEKLAPPQQKAASEPVPDDFNPRNARARGLKL